MKNPKEASVAAGIKGFQAPTTQIVRRKLTPEEMALAFEKLVASNEFDETVKKRGNSYVHYDDKTGAELGSYRDRETAWERQRQKRMRDKSSHHKHPKKHQVKNGSSLAPKPEKAPEPQLADKGNNEKRHVKEQFLEQFKKNLTELLRESSISYVFEQPQNSADAEMWNRFISSLSRDSLMSDQKLKNILVALQKSEMTMLNKAVKLVKDTLNKRGFQVKSMKGVKDEQGDMCVNIQVLLPKNKQVMDVAVKIENNKPLIQLPDETRDALNMMANDESKLFRAELVHTQEIELDNMDDASKVSAKRDNYLNNLQGKIDKIVSNLNPLELSMLKHLVKQKYRGVK